MLSCVYWHCLNIHECLSVCPSILHGLIFFLHAVDLMVIRHHPCVTIGSSSWRGALSLGVWPISGPQRGPDGWGVQGLFDQSGLRCGERQAGRSSRTGRRERDCVCQASEQESRAAITARPVTFCSLRSPTWIRLLIWTIYVIDCLISCRNHLYALSHVQQIGL